MSNVMKSIMAPLMVAVPIQAYTPLPDSSRVEVAVQQEGFLNELMAERPQSEKDLIMRGWTLHDKEKHAVEAQSSIDSLAYRKVFEGTELSKNSDAVKEFNKIAKESRPDRMWGFPTYTKKMDEILKNHGISSDEINKYKAENQRGRETFPGGFARYTSRDNRVAIAKHQFKVDSVSYKRFFEKHGMINEAVNNGFKTVSKKFKPVM